MKKIFVVVGTTGEYSDRSEWLVVAYVKQNKAKNRVLKAEKKAKELFKKYNGGYREIIKALEIGKEKNRYDRNMKIDYTGTTYYVVEVDLVET